MPQIDFTLVFAILKWLTYGAIAVYLFVAVGLVMLAARLEMRGGWMAWVPILNLYLLCRLARSSAIMIVPALIPILGLAVLAYLGARVARRLGMSPAVGVLFGVPFVGALMPIAMALGSGALPEGASGGAPSRKPIVAGLISVAVVVVLSGMGVTAFWLTGNMTKKAAPTAKAVAAALPPKTASTLTEFPLDTATVNAARPTRVVMQTFPKPKKDGTPIQVTIAPQQLPPWIEPASLPADVETIAAADYVSPEGGEPVRVATMVMRDGEDSTLFAPPSARDVASAGDGARATGIEVKNGEGEVYRGVKVSGSKGTYYAVAKTGTNIGIVISAGDEQSAVTADRLARNLGVGDGLLQDGDYAGIFDELPAAPDGGGWQGTFTMTESDIEELVRQVEHEAANLSPEDAGELAAFMPLIKQARALAPKRVGAGYNEAGDRQFAAGVISYANSRSAWMAFSAAEMAKRLVPIPEEVTIRSASIGGASGYYVAIRDGGHGMVVRAGSSILGFAAGPNVPEAELTRWAEEYARRRR